MIATTEISEVELTELVEHEGVIEKGLRTFVDVGNALLAIRDKRLYRQEYGAFEDYCKERWNMSRPRAYQLIEAAEVTLNLSTTVDKLPETESQARPLTKLEPELQTIAWQRAVDTAPNGKITADHVGKIVDSMLWDRQPYVTVIDEFGTEETVHRDDIAIGQDEILRAAEAIRRELADAKKDLLDQKKEEALAVERRAIVNHPKVYFRDAVSFLKDYPDNHFDLLLTDPPYMTDVDDIEGFVNNWLPVALDKVKPTGRAYICTGAYPKEISTYLGVLLGQSKFIVDNPLIWTYRNTLGQTPKTKYNLNYQMIWHLYSAESRELDTSVTNEMFSVQDINAPDGRQGDRYYTWQKPNELARRLITHSTKPGELIVDPFVGSGTFVLLASKLDRVAVGCDVSAEALVLAEKRGCNVLS